MPNGGHIRCSDCTYSRKFQTKCEIWGAPISVYLICRAFCLSKQSHTKSRNDFPFLDELEPGIVYEIDNNIFEAGNLRKRFQVIEID